MRTFGKAMRNSLPALGLGLISAFALASVSAVAAPAAMAQQQPQPQLKAKKEFVQNYNEANAAIAAKNWQIAIDKANAAEPFATDDQQRCVLAQIRTTGYFGLKNSQEVINNGEKAIALGCITGQQLRNYRQMLAGSYAEIGNEAKAMELTKSLIDEFGGTYDQYAYLGKRALDAKNYDDAIKYAQKAIEQAGKEGKSPGSAYNLMINAYVGNKNMDAYYDTLMKAAPLLNKPDYWRPLIARAMQEPHYKSQEALVDVLRALDGMGVPLKPEEQRSLGEQAYIRGSAIEAEKALDAVIKSGAMGGASDPQADRSKRFYAQVQADAKADKAGGLAQTEKEAATKPTGEVFISVGEAYMGNGDYTKAIEMFQKGIDKGQMEPGVTELAKLRLGIAQFKSGQKDEARKTWAGVTADNGAGWLAKVWTVYSKI